MEECSARWSAGPWPAKVTVLLAEVQAGSAKRLGLNGICHVLEVSRLAWLWTSSWSSLIP